MTQQIRAWRLTHRQGIAFGLMAALFLAAPAQGQAQYAPPAASEIPREHAATIEAYGGLYEGPVTAYVEEVGQRVAAAAGRPGRCSFHVVNSSQVNAFTSPPACHVYVSRGLLALINSEDELAAVLGHEVGHVVANHAGGRQQRSVLSGLGAALVGAVTGSSELGRVAGALGQLNVLSYSRNQEYEADTLGVRYIGQAGYAPSALADMLGSLQSEDQLEQRQRGAGAPTSAAPAWARTHPLTGERIARAARQAGVSGGPTERVDPYLAAIDGMTWGDDPSQGFVDGRRFAHPALGITFQAPQGFALTNGPRAVRIEGPGGVRGEFATGAFRGQLEDYARQVLQGTIGSAQAEFGQPQRTRINGIDAYILPAYARTRSGLVEVTVAAYDLGGAGGRGGLYHFVTVAPQGGSGVFDPLFESFERLDPRRATGLRTKIIQVVQVRPGETLESLASRMAEDDLRLERFLTLNSLEPGATLRPGQRVKLVSYLRR